MNYRSWLLVPGNSEKQLRDCVGSCADVVIVDLEDSVPVEHKQLARNNSAEWLASVRGNGAKQGTIGRWVRINPMSTPMWREDLMAIMPAAPDGILLPKAEGPEAMRLLGAELYEIEERCGILANSTRIIPLVGETPRSAMTISDYLGECHQRIAGLTWGAHDLAAALSATSSYEAGRGWSDAFKFVRAQTLLTAYAAGTMAIDTSYVDFEDKDGLASVARASHDDGFTGMVAIHPDQVETINRAFTPTQEAIQEAQDIIAAFDASPGLGALQFNGRMIDKPHLKLARHMLGIAAGEGAPAAIQRTSILRPA